MEAMEGQWKARMGGGDDAPGGMDPRMEEGGHTAWMQAEEGRRKCGMQSKNRTSSHTPHSSPVFFHFDCVAHRVFSASSRHSSPHSTCLARGRSVVSLAEAQNYGERVRQSGVQSGRARLGGLPCPHAQGRCSPKRPRMISKSLASLAGHPLSQLAFAIEVCCGLKAMFYVWQAPTVSRRPSEDDTTSRNRVQSTASVSSKWFALPSSGGVETTAANAR
jgi:hypothetical protein